MSESKFVGKIVTVKKVIDEVFNGNHPNGKNEGYETTGRLVVFEVGKSAYLQKDDGRDLSTSTIGVINEEMGMFETKNSIYTIKLAEGRNNDENPGAAFGGLNMIVG
jgi:hypothetical protein